jgi:hypothetical protein
MQTLMFSYAAQHSFSVINESDLKHSMNASDAKFLLVQEGRVVISGSPARLILKTKSELGSELALLPESVVWLSRQDLAKARETPSTDSVLLQPVGLLGRSLVDAWSMT